MGLWAEEMHQTIIEQNFAIIVFLIRIMAPRISSLHHILLSHALPNTVARKQKR